jgi:polyhydroxyalkanoate synthesis regulator phasin
MQTIKIEIEDSLYQNIIDSGINIQEKLKDMMYDLIDDGYPFISTQEAKKRVSDAVERYESKKGAYSPYDTNFTKNMNQYIDSL